MKKIFTLYVLLILIASLKVFAQTTPGTISNQAPVETTKTGTETGNLINVGDILDIRVFNRPQLSREAVKVDDQGKVKMPFLDSPIQAACMNERTLAEEITTQYKQLLRQPQVDVSIKEYHLQPYAAVIGSVRTPSRLQMQMGKQIPLLELLAFVGGPTEKAGKSIQVIHGSKDMTCNSKTSSNVSDEIADQPAFYNLKSALAGDVNSNPYIGPGDIVIIPEADLIQIFVVGNVLKPSTLSLPDPITVSQAIAMSGGTLPDTKSEKVRVLRQLPGGTAKSEIIINIKDLEKHPAQDIVLQSNDILEIPVNGGRRLLRTFIGAIVPSIAQLPVRVIP